MSSDDKGEKTGKEHDEIRVKIIRRISVSTRLEVEVTAKSRKELVSKIRKTLSYLLPCDEDVEDDRDDDPFDDEDEPEEIENCDVLRLWS